MGTIIRAACGYWVLLIVLRLVGRRALEQMTPFEIILMFMLGGIMIQAIVADDRSMVNAILGVLTVASMHVLVTRLKQWSRSFGRWVDGTPVVIVDDRGWHPERMSALRIHKDDVMAAARQRGLKNADDIGFAVAERNGAISIIQQQQP
jgi:uncharacterized membrane protein YcaP (DUF421 family)